MRFVFRVLSSNIKNNIYTLKSGAKYYEIPLVYRKNDTERITHIAVPVEKTYQSGDNLYLVLDTTSKTNDIFLTNAASINDNQALTLINNDFINYIIDKNYNHNLPHIVNNLMPIGIQRTTVENHRELDRWSITVHSLLQKYGKNLLAIDPLTTNNLYPFHYTNFLEHKFIREYRSNIIMFTLTFDKNYHYEENKIYYEQDENIIPMYEMINDEQFYIRCDEKDEANHATKPFLRSFNDHGLAKEIVQFMKEDKDYNILVREVYKKFREELQLENEIPTNSSQKDKNKLYFIPSLDSNRALRIRHNKQLNLPVSKDEEDYLNAALTNRMKLLVELYDENKISYFTSEDLVIDENKLVINSALKRVVELNIEDIMYNPETKTIYHVSDYNGKDVYTPILEVISKEQIKELKDQIYNNWIEEKKRKSR